MKKIYPLVYYTVKTGTHTKLSAKMKFKKIRLKTRFKKKLYV